MPDYPEYYRPSTRILVVVLGPYGVEIPDKVAFVRVLNPTTPMNVLAAETRMRIERPLFFLEPLYPEYFDHGLPPSFDNTDMVMIAVTGSNEFDILLAERIAEECRSRDILTLGIRELEPGISVENDPVCPVLEPHVNSMVYGLRDVKTMAVQENIVKSAPTLYRMINGISDPLLFSGFVAIDFADIKSIFIRGGFTPFVSVTAVGVERGKRVGELAAAELKACAVDMAAEMNLFLSMFVDANSTLDEVSDATKYVAEMNNSKGGISFSTVFSMQELRKSLIDGLTLSIYVSEFHRDYLH